MRVLFISTLLPRPERHNLGVWGIEQLAAFKRAGIEIRVLSPQSWVPKILALGKAKAWANCPASQNLKGIEVEYPRWLMYQSGPHRQAMSKRPGPYLSVGWNSISGYVLRAVEEFRPDVIFSHQSQSGGYVAWRLHRKTKIPFVVTDHDFGEVEDCLKYPARRKLISAMWRDASGVVAVANRMRESMLQVEPRARAVTVHNGGSAAPTNVKPRPAEWGGRVVLLSAGGFFERKDFPGLIRAFARVAPKHPEVTLRIIGAGAQHAEVVRLTEELGVASQVEFLGSQPHARVLEEMSWCDAFVLIGWGEPWGVVYTEAMASGKPIICCSDGGINDVVQDGVHGLVVPPRDVESAARAIERIVTNHGERAEMGEKARMLATRHLTWDRNASSMIDLFGKAVAEVRLG